MIYCLEKYGLFDTTVINRLNARNSEAIRRHVFRATRAGVTGRHERRRHLAHLGARRLEQLGRDLLRRHRALRVAIGIAVAAAGGAFQSTQSGIDKDN